jgi:FkbM family methyltransferase
MFLEKCIEAYVDERVRVVHCGGHKGQEQELYDKFNFSEIAWVEAIPDLADFLTEKFKLNPQHKVISSALWSESGVTLDFHISSNSKASSSLLTMKEHKNTFPEVHVTEVVKMITSTLDEIFNDTGPVSLLLLDLQGVELPVLRGGLQLLENTSHVYVEVSLTELYTNQPLFSDILNFMYEKDFTLQDFEIVERTGHGNAFFSKNSKSGESLLSALSKVKRLETECTKSKRSKRNFPRIMFWAFGIRHYLLKIGVPIRLMRRPRFLVRHDKGQSKYFSS